MTHNIKLINITKSLLCRICLQKGEIPIFGSENHEDISAKLQKASGVEISANDKLCMYLCSCCYSSLEGVLLFQNLAQESNESLQKCTKFLVKNNIFIFDLLKPKKNKDNAGNTERHQKNYSVHTGDEESHNKQSDIKEFFSSFREITTLEREKETDNEITELILSLPDKKQLLETIKVDAQNHRDEESTGTPTPHEEILIEGSQLENQEINVFTTNAYEEEDDYEEGSIETLETEETNMSVYDIIDKSKQDSMFKRAKKYPKLYKPIEQQMVSCPLCNNSFNRKEFKFHIDTHKEPNVMKLNCTFCGRLYSKSNYCRHVNLHFTQQAICDYCGKQFIDNNRLREHMVKHIDTCPFKCPNCPYQGKTLNRLKRHIVRIHSSIRSVMCQECGKVISDKRAFVKHQQVHQRKRQFRCDTCNIGFSSEERLQKHITEIHAGF